jgi:hypothetical protein
MAPWPLPVFDAGQVSGVNPVHPEEIISKPLIADIDDDGTLEMVFGTNEDYSTPAPAPLPGLPGGSGRVYAYEPDGTLEPGWPVMPTSIAPSAVPLVADGVGTSPVAADVDGDNTLEIAIGLLGSDSIIYNHDGTTFATMSGTMAATGAGSDADEVTPEGGHGPSSDQPVRHYVGVGAFADVENDTLLDYMVGTLGIGIVPFALASGAPTPFDHYLSVWNATTGVHKAGFPRVMEDWQFFTGAAVADIDGAVGGLPEMIASSGGYFVHAFNALGVEPTGWPKNVGQWVVMSPSVGDLDDDGDLEVVVATRLGDLHVWDMPGGACGNVQWRKAGHDEWASGLFGKDVLRPARIEDLAGTESGSNVTLTWTAVGDDGKCGTASVYALRAANVPITLANFGSATPITIAPPATSGTPESRVVTPPAGARFFALRARDEAGNAGPLATFQLPGPFTLRRVRLVLPGAGQDRLTLRGSLAQSLGTLGLPGTSVTLALSDAGGEYFRATVPASELVSNASGTRVRFRDRTGTIAGGLRRLVMSDRLGGTRLSVRGRGLNLNGASAGPFTATLEVGPFVLTAPGTFRAAGMRLVFP